jgi:cold shock CspA family protein
VKRSDFNSLKIGTSVTYEVEKGETATIAQVDD